MSGEQSISTKPCSTGLVVEGANFSRTDADGESLWQASPIDKNRVLLHTKSSHVLFADCRHDFARTSVSLLRTILIGLIADRFTGTILIDTGRGHKKVFFEGGDIVFASSDQIDDRMGEVIYQERMINLNQLMDAAVKVTRTQKFGQVLLEAEIFQPITLWNALKLQVRGIVESVFLVNHVFYQIRTDDAPPFTRIRFPGGALELVEEGASLGHRLRAFLKRLSTDSLIKVSDGRPCWQEPQEGTFEDDFLILIRESGSVGALVKQSKLADINTYRTLYQFVNRGLCTIVSPLEEVSIPPFGMGDIKSRLDSYQLLLKFSAEAFSAEGLEVPISQLESLLSSLESSVGDFIRLGHRGNIERDSIYAIYQVSKQSLYSFQRVVFALDSLIAFLMQIATDLLPPERGKKIKNAFLEIVA